MQKHNIHKVTKGKLYMYTKKFKKNHVHKLYKRTHV